MSYILSLLVAITSILFSVWHLKQTPTLYFDMVAIAVVFGGTFAVMLVVMPWRYFDDIRFAANHLLVPHKSKMNVLAQDAMKLVQASGSGRIHGFQPSLEKGIAAQVLKDGAELLSLGMPVDSVHLILKERIHQQASRLREVGNAVRSLSKYPPAFGLVGTVLGLVSLMRAVSDGAGSEETGVRMAVALVATLYGLLVANLIINPAGEGIIKIANEEVRTSELALQGVLLAGEKRNLLESQEMINSFLLVGERINLIGSQVEKESSAA